MADDVKVGEVEARLRGSRELRDQFKQSPHEHFQANGIELSEAESQKLSSLNLHEKSDEELMGMLQPPGTMKATMF